MSKSSREIALGVLLAVDMEGAYSNIALNKHIDSSISRLDENLIRELVYGVLENKMYLDWIIKRFSKIKVSKIVEDKVNDFDLDQLEEMIRGVSSPELRAIEILGGVLGLIIGIVQDGILLLLG